MIFVDEPSVAREIESRVAECRDVVIERFPTVLPSMPVIKYFDKRSAAGLAFLSDGSLAFHARIAKHHLDETLTNTVPHEVAHLAVRDLELQGRVKSNEMHRHGKTWRYVMHVLGTEPLRTTTVGFELTGARRQRRWTYSCACERPVMLTTLRHNRVQQGRASFRCKRCRATLEYLAPLDGATPLALPSAPRNQERST